MIIHWNQIIKEYDFEKLKGMKNYVSMTHEYSLDMSTIGICTVSYTSLEVK